jgi:SAM-dependent methyltransferase
MRRRARRDKPLQTPGKRLKTAAKWLLRPKTLILNSAFTRQLVRRYCSGRGCEIGPGLNPQTNPASTIYVDRFKEYRGLPMQVDVVADAGGLPFADASLDYVFASHVLEHCPDVIAVLSEWLRVLKPKGRLALRLPHGERTFDRGRRITDLQHHIDDHAQRVNLSDTTHWPEFADVSIPAFDHHWKREARKLDGSYNFDYVVSHGHMHYHVWTQTEMVDLLRYLSCPILFMMDKPLDRDDSFCVIAEKPPAVVN